MVSNRTLTYLVPVIAVLAYLGSIVLQPLLLRLEVVGVTRFFSSIENIHGHGLQIDRDFPGCEDFHYHEPSGLLFGTSQTNNKPKGDFFPPLEMFGDVESCTPGQLFVFDPMTKSKKILTLRGFRTPFVVHGIDIYSPPDNKELVYIFAVNHQPNPAYSALKEADVPKARSQIEVFKHQLGSSEAQWLRAVVHPVIRTPNDIYVVDEHNFYITNDHFHREGLARAVEDLGWRDIAPWSDISYIKLETLNSPHDPTAAVSAKAALKSLANPNGFGHGKTADEIVLGHAASGNVSLVRDSPDHKLTIFKSIQMPNTVDNPTYFHDPYATETGHDASGYIIAGLTQGIRVLTGETNLSMNVWHVDPALEKRKLLFQDDGQTYTSASTALLVAIDPKTNQGKKQAWLFVTGPIGPGLAYTTIDL